MKLRKLRAKKGNTRKRTISEDLRYLQKAISGRSVYRSQLSSYIRRPKHRHAGYQF